MTRATATFPGFGGHAGELTHSVVPPNRKDDIVIPKGYDQAVIIAWGDPVEAGAPKFDVNKQTRGRAGQAVRLQQRLHDDRAAERRPEGVAGLQPRVHRRVPDVPDRQVRRQDACRDRPGRARHVGGPDRARRPHVGQWRRDGEGSRYNRRITATTKFEVDRPGRCRQPGRKGCLRHLRQLRRRRHPVGHDPVRRGELQRVLRRQRHRPGGVRRQLQAVRRTDDRDQVGPAVEHRRPALGPDQDPDRGVPRRLDRRGRPVRPEVDAEEAHHARPDEARGRDHHDHRRRPDRGVPRRRRARRVHLQVRLDRCLRLREPEEELRPARRGHPVRRQVHRRRRRRTACTTAPASGSR